MWCAFSNQQNERMEKNIFLKIQNHSRLKYLIIMIIKLKSFHVELCMDSWTKVLLKKKKIKILGHQQHVMILNSLFQNRVSFCGKQICEHRAFFSRY